MQLTLPFSSKELANGKKLYRRKHGYTLSLAASTTTEYVVTVPYTDCKINEAEVLWAPEGVTVSMQVLDTTSGTYTTVPNYLLSEYGTDVVVAKDFYKDTSPYDADVKLNMQIKFIFVNNSTTAKDIGVNVTFHEVV